MGLQETVYENVDFIKLAYDRDQGG